MTGRKIRKIVLALAVVATSAPLVDCGPGANAPKAAEVEAGPMPKGAEWRGVYFSKVYGNLHLVKEGANVTGKWRTAGGEKWGEMHGTVDGDLYRFNWTEHKIGMVGPSSSVSGKGYFRFVRPKNGDPDRLVGEWGMDKDEVGYKWEATKQQNMEPDPDSVMPDEVEGSVSGGEWDDKGPPKAYEKPKGEELAPEGGEGETKDEKGEKEQTDKKEKPKK